MGLRARPRRPRHRDICADDRELIVRTHHDRPEAPAGQPQLDRVAEPELQASSAGQAMTATSYLDAHFEVCRPEYEATLRAVGIQPGWRVLDAGCCGGSFLPPLAEGVGPRRQASEAGVPLRTSRIATPLGGEHPRNGTVPA
jgi:hypothetical protein